MGKAAPQESAEWAVGFDKTSFGFLGWMRSNGQLCLAGNLGGLVCNIANRWIKLNSLLGDLFSNYTSIRIMKHAATLDLDQFEDSVLIIRAPRQQTVGQFAALR
jgi:hypothetical protein